ncbi:MAG: hypothetical protein EXR62_14330 [Chloroflexi bacterium]|nr:hypothetical protein [Chloroflexota bacterium]
MDNRGRNDTARDDSRQARLDALLDWFADEMAERIAARQRWGDQPVQLSAPSGPPPPIAPAEVVRSLSPEPAPQPEFVPVVVASTGPSHAALLMARLALGLLIAIVLINIPLNSQGTALARSIPSSSALIIRNGLVVKEAASPEIYVYRDGAFHWITTLDAFDYFGYRWRDVQLVEPGFLDQFAQGKPIYVLLKCEGSPHIYRLEEGQKRWIVDIPTFEAEGYIWQDVKMVPCSKLHGLSDGDSIPPGRGLPPPPLP